MAQNKNESPLVETPAAQDGLNDALTVTEISATPEISAEEKELAEARAAIAAKKVAEAKIEQDAKILELQKDIQFADAEVIKYKGIMSGTGEMDKMIQDLVNSQPGRLDAINASPAIARQALADYRLSILSPEEREVRTKYQALLDSITQANLELEKLRTDYPALFSTKAAPKAPKAPTGEPKAQTTTTGAATGFDGDFLSKEDMKALMIAKISEATGGVSVKDYYASGNKLSQSEIAKKMYGDGDWNLAAANKDGKVLKFHIHPTWKALVLDQIK